MNDHAVAASLPERGTHRKDKYKRNLFKISEVNGNRGRRRRISIQHSDCS
jgi:hypothetical protein